MAEYDDLNAGTITIVGVISAILTFVIIAAAQVMYYQYSNYVADQKLSASGPTASQMMIDEQVNSLNSYEWVDREKMVVSIPIDLAMEEVLQELTDSSEVKK